MISKKNILTYLFLFISVVYCFSQKIKINYSHTNNDSLKIYFKEVHKNYLDRFTGEYKSEIKKLLKNQDKYFIHKIKDSVYQFDSKIETYLDNILNEIYTSNVSIKPNKFKFFLKNNISLNASCYGNGVFEINVGTFPSLENDAELAFIICHEIAHYNLEHSKKSITKYIALQHSKELDAKLKDINDLDYGKNKALFKLLNQFNINVLKHSKNSELEADSLGFNLFKNTKYNLPNAISTLKKLEDNSNITYKTNIKLDSIFNLKNYPFKKYWLEVPKPMFSSNKVINDFKMSSDTLKTHPAIPLRIKKLKPYITTSNNEIKKDLNLKSINQILIPKIYQLTLDKKRYDISLYLLVDYLLKKYISKQEYTAKMSSLLLNIYLLKKQHNLGKYIPLTNKFSKEKELNTIRLFINTIENSELKKLGLEFCLENKIEKNTEFNKNLNQFKTLNKL